MTNKLGQEIIQSSSIEITGILKNWVIHDHESGAQYVTGNLYNDVHERWHDGVPIRTSAIKQRNGNIIITLNSVYRLADKN